MARAGEAHRGEQECCDRGGDQGDRPIRQRQDVEAIAVRAQQPPHEGEERLAADLKRAVRPAGQQRPLPRGEQGERMGGRERPGGGQIEPDEPEDRPPGRRPAAAHQEVREDDERRQFERDGQRQREGGEPRMRAHLAQQEAEAEQPPEGVDLAVQQLGGHGSHEEQDGERGGERMDADAVMAAEPGAEHQRGEQQDDAGGRPEDRPGLMRQPAERRPGERPERGVLEEGGRGARRVVQGGRPAVQDALRDRPVDLEGHQVRLREREVDREAEEENHSHQGNGRVLDGAGPLREGAPHDDGVHCNIARNLA